MGKKVLGGGYQVTGGIDDIYLWQSFPQTITSDADGNTVAGWQILAFNKAANSLPVHVHAVCASVL